MSEKNQVKALSLVIARHLNTLSSQLEIQDLREGEREREKTIEPSRLPIQPLTKLEEGFSQANHFRVHI